MKKKRITEPQLNRAVVRRQAERDRFNRTVEYDQAMRVLKQADRVSGFSDTRLEPIGILAEGDSWFDLPAIVSGGDVITRLTEIQAWPILNMAHAGDETRQMLGVSQRKRLETLLGDTNRNFQALLFSGGGNDIVGDPLVLWLKDRRGSHDPAQALNPETLDSALGIILAAYRQLLEIRNRIIQDQPGRRIHLFFHQYDFAIPTGMGVCGYGPWLKPSLDYRGWDETGIARKVIKLLMLRFAAILDQIAVSNTDVHVVRTQGLLDDSDWHDELHPNSGGFRKIANAFLGEFKRVFPASFPG